MKKLFLLSTSVLIVLITLLYAKERINIVPKLATTRNEAKKFGNFQFEETFHDFGHIQDGDTVYHTFRFTNNGNAPLVIGDISTGCGCTAASWTKKPVLPQASGEIKLRFSKHHDPGVHLKTAIVKANTEDPYTILHIKAII